MKKTNQKNSKRGKSRVVSFRIQKETEEQLCRLMEYYQGQQFPPKKGEVINLAIQRFCMAELPLYK